MTTKTMEAPAAKAETAEAAPQTALARVPQQTAEVVRLGFDTVSGFEGLQRAARLLAASSLVPEAFRGQLANCVVALNMAARIGADPLMVMQNLYIVHGRPAWSAVFLIASFNSCGRFSALRYEFVGKQGSPEWGCRAWAVERETGQRLEGATITMGLAKLEGWLDKPGSKWKTIPQQMMMYRAASFFVKAHAPELAMGLQTREEIEDMVVDTDLVPDAQAAPPRTLDALADKIGTPATGEVIDAVADAMEAK